MTLSGVAIPNFKSGRGREHWSAETIELHLDLSAPIDRMVNDYEILVNEERSIVFSADQWASFATINAIYDEGAAVDAGFAVDSWRPLFGLGIESETGAEIKNIFYGLEIDIGARDPEAWLYRVGYHVTLIGKMVLTDKLPIS